jgi:hypothetical protein
MSAQLEQGCEVKNMTAEELAQSITESIIESRDALIAERDAQIAAANAPLDAERELLLQEHAAIEEAAHSLELLLPAREREAQRQADVLLLDGKQEEAAAKIAESEEARTAPEAMKERQREISARIEAIAGEKKTIAKRIFADWYTKLQAIVRAAEHGLFIELLDKSRAEMYAYQERHNLGGTLKQPFSHLVKDSHLVRLTADERTAEWNSGSRWYGGRGR